VDRLQDMGMTELQGQSTLPAQGLSDRLKGGRPPRHEFEAHIHPQSSVLGQPYVTAGFIPKVAQDYIAPRHHIAGFEGIGASLIHGHPPSLKNSLGVCLNLTIAQNHYLINPRRERDRKNPPAQISYEISEHFGKVRK
jgi:hypothetical protein